MIVSRATPTVLSGHDQHVCSFETYTANGTHMYVLTVIKHTNRRIRIEGATEHPTASWVTQAARSLVMNLEDAGQIRKIPDPNCEPPW